MLVFVGTYTEPILFGTGKVLQGKGEGIYALRFDAATGALEPAATTTGVPNPSYLAMHPSRKSLYAVNELKSYEGRASGSVTSFSVDARTGALALLNTRATHGTDPCHVTVGAAGKHAFVANFASGSVCVLPLEADGALGKPSDVLQHRGSSLDPRRQAGPHAHSVTLDASNHCAFVPDLGLDKVMIYRFDAQRGTLVPGAPPWIAMLPGSGPRHLAFHPSGRLAFAVNELDSTITALSYDGNGGLQPLQTVSTLPAGFGSESTCADIRVHPSGSFVYASNRGHDSIAVFRVDPARGTLHAVAHVSTGGRTPRSFAIDPSGRFLLAANQDSDCIVTFAVDGASGSLRPTGQVTAVPTPVCIVFSEDPR